MRLDLTLAFLGFAQTSLGADPTPSTAGAKIIMDNSQPILPQAPGLTLGKNLKKIRIDGCYDLLCEHCNNFRPVFDSFVNAPLSDKIGKIEGATTYADLIHYSYNFFPLTFHGNAWLANKITPVMIEECREDMTKCKLFKYMDWLEATDSTDTQTPKRNNYTVLRENKSVS